MAVIAAARSGKARPATAPRIAEPSSTGSSAGDGDHRLAGGVGEDLADQVGGACAAADHNALDRGAAGCLGLDDLAEAVADAAETGDVQGDEARLVGLHSEAGDHSSGVRVGEGRAVAEELGHDVQPACEVGDTGKVVGAGGGGLRQPAEERLALRPGAGAQAVGSRMEGHQMVDGGARGGLAALVQPERRAPWRRSRAPRRRARRQGRSLSSSCRRRCRRRKPSRRVGAPNAPTVPMPPAWASIRPAATGVPGRRPRSPAAASVRPRPRAVPGSTTSVPMRSKPSSASTPRPMARK